MIRGILLMFLSPEAIVRLFGALKLEKFDYLYSIVGLTLGLYLTYTAFRR